MDEDLIKVIGVFLVIGLLFECVILGIAFFGADEVDCNLLWCEFKTTRTSISDSIIIETHQTCFLNGYEINCNDNRTKLPKILTDGNFDSKPTFKHNDDWKDVLE
jgi:hypothetical protein